MEAKLLNYIDEHKEVLFNTLSELVKINTENFLSHGNENAGQRYLEKICKDIGLEVDRFTPDSIEGLTEHIDYMPGRGTDKRENLVAIFEGNNPEKNLMIAAHMDTMPLGNPDEWDDSPLSGIIKDGKIYGRGTGDDKFGLAVAWFLIKAFKDLGIKPNCNILIGSYIDEECGGGNGALGLGLKYPCDCVINLDSSGFEKEALGGGCFRLKLVTTKNDKAIASVFDVFTGVNLIKEELEKLHGTGKTTVRFSNFEGGKGGVKEATINIAVYTDMSREETQSKLDDIVALLTPELKKLNLATEGFISTTRYFHYGKTDKNSKEAKILTELITQETGEAPDTKGTCLSDLSLILKYNSENSFNYGMPRGSETGGGAHQPNEHIECEKLLKLTKNMAKLIMRI